MSKRSRCDAFGSFYLDLPRDARGAAIPMPLAELQRFEAELRAFIESRGFAVRDLKFDVKDGRFVP